MAGAVQSVAVTADRRGRPRRSWGMVATPFGPDASAIDTESLTSLVASMLRDGLDGLVVLGVIAEPEALSEDEKGHVLETVLDAAGASDAPVSVCCMATDAATRGRELDMVADRFAGRLHSLMLPVPSADPRRLRAEVVAANRATGLPVYVQDYPAATGATIEVDDLADALVGLPVLGVKCEAAPSTQRIHTLARRHPGLELMSGLGGVGLAADLASGADSLACGITRPAALVRALAVWNDDPRAALEVLSAITCLAALETQPEVSIGIRKEHWRRRGVISTAALRHGQPYPDHLDDVSTLLLQQADAATGRGVQ